MIQREFEELLEQFSQDELNEKSTVKGQFTSYITRRMEWHAIRYAAKNRPNVIVISLDQAPRHLTDIDAEQMLQPLSRPLQPGIRFFRPPVPAPSLASLTGNLPCSYGKIRAYHVPLD